MRLLSLDFDPVYGKDATRTLFAGDVSVFDYDVVIWDPAASFSRYLTTYSGRFQNLPELPEHTSVQIASDARRRRTEFAEFVNSGRILIVVVRPPQACYIDTGERQYSGTGRNQKTTRILSRFDLLSALPTKADTRFVAAKGSRFEFDGTGPIQNVLRKYKDRLQYEAVIENPPGTVLAHVAGTQRQLASIHRSTTGGYLVLLPPVDLERELADGEELDDNDEGWSDDAPQFQADLLAAISQLSGKVTARPEWAASYATVRQQELQVAVIEQQAKIEAAREAHAKLRQELEESEARDQLFLGTGRALELEVKAVLELLGGSVTEPQPGRDDWKVDFPEGKAVVEVKGVSKSAAEKHAAQLEKWVATELEETGKSPKGILVVNTWRDTPLKDRSDKEDFPNQMLPYAKGRSHCLISGLQLFVIREDVESKPDRAEYWRQKIMKTSGSLAGASDWKAVIKVTDSAE